MIVQKTSAIISSVAATDTSRPKGPIHQVTPALRDCEAKAEGPTKWEAPGYGEVVILTTLNIRAIFRDMAVQAMWMELARRRSGYDGLGGGLGYKSTLCVAVGTEYVPSYIMESGHPYEQPGSTQAAPSVCMVVHLTRTSPICGGIAVDTYVKRVRCTRQN